MPRRPEQFAILFRKLVQHLALLGRDPEKFGRNLLQYTDPGLFQQRLIDVLDAVPMHVKVDAALSSPPHLNVLNAALTRSGMTGGPNTIINLALRVARLGVPVRLVTTVTASTLDPAWFRAHAIQLVGDPNLPDVPIVNAADPTRPMIVGANDIFLATHWTTAQQLKTVLPRMAVKQFFYMLQEFEPAFYAWSSNHALAMETYSLDFWPVFNEALLASYMMNQGIGRFADPRMHDRLTVFEPAIEERLFHPAETPIPRPKRLLFYARPTNTRNMFGLGIMALRQASADPALAGWQFLAIGGRGSVPPMALQGGHTLQPAEWMDYAGYARSLREADVLLCPMLSPHTSYPVLEMAASGGLSVTNTFATKTREELEKLSDNIVATEPTVEAMAAGVITAAQRTNTGCKPTGWIRLARDWATTLDPAAARLVHLFTHVLSKPCPG